MDVTLEFGQLAVFETDLAFQASDLLVQSIDFAVILRMGFLDVGRGRPPV